ncbi:MAG TPA: CYTH and CHAD domain-containing protein [Candidatus Dormibacteraeota bacterium]|nr:CYTH and CHAD domain-containing protein [Candidatus Dormibacteraeota bacterium]
MTVESEAKLAAPTNFELPPMEGLANGAAAMTRPRLELEATYYDTDDLALARWGITLRHRSGEAGPTWTVKLPQAATGRTMARDELTFAGAERAIPPEAADLVRAYVRGRALIPVARLHTSRKPIEIQKSDGTTLVEIVDDAVSVHTGRRVTRRFREVEVEAKDGAPAQAVLRSAVRRIASAGAQDGQPMPKLVRALGARARRPPEVVVPELGREPRPDELVRHAIAASVVQLLQRDALVRLGDDEEGVHKFRVATRRLRSDLGTFICLLDREQVERLRQELRWLGREVGRVRDNEVLAENLQRSMATLPAGDVAVAQQLIKRLRRETAQARESMLAAMRSRRYDRLLDELVRLAGSHRRGRRDAVDMPKLVRKRWRGLAAAVGALGDDPPDAALHNVRIKAKRCRYAAEAVVPAEGKRAARLALAVSELQTVLGEHQDTVVAEQWLRAAAEASPASRLVAGELVAHQRAERARLRREWPSVWKTASSKRLRAWF